jgi:hypothetical protein
MTQGSLKKKAPVKAKSVASQRKVKKLSKGRKSFDPKGRKVDHIKEENDISKAINKKNEAIVASKAIRAGSRFFCSDVAMVGNKQLEKSSRVQIKHENKSTSLSDRLKDQLKKIERDI